MSRLLDSQDDYVRLKSSVVTATLLAADRHPADADIAKLLGHLNNLIRWSTYQYPSCSSLVVADYCSWSCRQRV